MLRRQIYAHWLDPDYLGKRALGRHSFGERAKEFEGILKVHALFGDSLSLSNVQPIESSLLLHLFNDPNFCHFVKVHPDFLRLVAEPTEYFGAKPGALATVERGLYRIVDLRDKYVPHTFSSPTTVPHVAEMFRGIRDENEAEALFRPHGKLRQFVNAHDGNDKVLLEGLLNSLSHFIFDEGVPIRQPKAIVSPSSYYQELENSCSMPEPDQSRLKKLLEETMTLAENNDERKKRTLILSKMPNAHIPGHEDRRRYLLVIQAWNTAVFRASDAETASGFCFRETFPIPVYSGRTTHCSSSLVPAAGEDDFMLSTIPKFDWHPSSLDWKTLNFSNPISIVSDGDECGGADGVGGGNMVGKT